MLVVRFTKCTQMEIHVLLMTTASVFSHKSNSEITPAFRTELPQFQTTGLCCIAVRLTNVDSENKDKTIFVVGISLNNFSFKE